MISHDILVFPDLHIVRIQRCTNSTAPVPVRRHYKSAPDSPVKVKNKGRACVEVVPKIKVAFHRQRQTDNFPTSLERVSTAGCAITFVS